MGSHPSSRHMHTEKRRRDRIATGFETLRSLVPTADRRADKATFLQQVVSYVHDVQDAIQNVASEGGLDSFPEETRWQIRLLLPNLQPDNPMNQLQPASGSDNPMPSLPSAAPSLEPASSSQQPQEEVDPQRQPQSSGFRLGELQGFARGFGMQEGGSESGNVQRSGQVVEEQASFRPLKRGRMEQQASESLDRDWRPAQAERHRSSESPKQHDQGKESREAEAARVSQLQQLLLQMQAQQAANAQQLQMQQAALMRNQVFSAMSLNQILQRNMRDQNAASEGRLQGALQQQPQGGQHQWLQSQQGAPEAGPSQVPNPNLGASGYAAQSASPEEGGNQAGQGLKRVLSKPRRQPKIRNHTTVGQFSAAHEGIPQTSPDSLSGRPDRSTSSSGAQDSP